jgi:hypothetical protein
MKNLSTYITESDGSVKNRKFLKLMKSAGLEKVLLCKGDGYYYITSDDDDTWALIDSLPETTIYVNSFNQQYPEQWVDDIKQLLSKAEK